MKKYSVVFLSTIFMGCVNVPDYAPKVDSKVASIAISSTNDSTKTTVRTLAGFVFEGKCQQFEEGTRLGNTLKNEGFQELHSAKIPAEKEITLSVIYGDARFNENRACNSTVKFSPVENHQYSAFLEVSDEGMKCSLSIQDETLKEVVSLSIPEYACEVQGVAPYKNMQPAITEYEFLVQYR